MCLYSRFEEEDKKSVEEDKKSVETLCNTNTKLALTSKAADNILKAVKVTSFSNSKLKKST